MNSLLIEGKSSTPTVIFNESGVLSITGRSIPEHPIKFYKPVEDWLSKFLSKSPEKVYLKIQLDYLNTHSTECVLSLLKMLESYSKLGETELLVLWNFEEDDEDMETLGNDLKSLLQIPFKVEEIV